MKIRTNFVTNSSSYSSAEIKIDNPVLLEIMKKYKKQGAFIDEDGWDRGSFMARRRKGKTLAFYYLEEEQAEIFYAPSRVEDVVKCILKVISWNDNIDFENESLYRQFKGELEAHASDINNSYQEVYWDANNNGYGESAPAEGAQTNWHFEYHK